jgi:1-acyl-sn-glycerol-3-phosphate acyltransferase
MRANRFQSFLIVFRSLAFTLWISIISIFRVYRGTETREACDRRLRWWSAKLLQNLRLSYSSYNTHEVSFHGSKPYIIMSNHSSLCDIPLILVTIPGSIRMLTKKELFHVPIWGRGMQAGEFISIDRNDRRQAVKDLQYAKEKLESGIILWVAPEGTRSDTGELGPFKKGGFMLAIRTGAYIVPVGIRGAYDVLPPRTLQFHLGKHAEVHVGKPVDASLYAPKNRDLLMFEVERQIRALAGLSSQSS